MISAHENTVCKPDDDFLFYADVECIIDRAACTVFEAVASAEWLANWGQADVAFDVDHGAHVSESSMKMSGDFRPFFFERKKRLNSSIALPKC